MKSFLAVPMPSRQCQMCNGLPCKYKNLAKMCLWARSLLGARFYPSWFQVVGAPDSPGERHRNCKVNSVDAV
jgi:hypothetical protein